MTHMKPIAEQVRVAEIRHRMINGFQMLQSFTSLEMSNCETQEATDKLRVVLAQIETIAAQQTALTEADSGNFAGFVETIAPLWQRIGENAGISVNVDLDANVRLSPVASESASRILQEAVTNCVEHAFPDGRGGNIEVGIGTKDAYHCQCRIADDGVGLPDEAGGVGTGIIRSLAEELGGQATWTKRPRGGTVLTVDFPVNLPENVEAMNKATV